MLRFHASRPTRTLSGEIRRFLRRSSASVAPVSLRKDRRLFPAEAHAWFFALFTARSPASRGIASTPLPAPRRRGFRVFSRLLSPLKGIRDALNAVSPETPVRAPGRSASQEIRLRRKRRSPEAEHPEQGRSAEDRKPGTGLGGGR